MCSIYGIYATKLQHGGPYIHTPLAFVGQPVAYSVAIDLALHTQNTNLYTLNSTIQNVMRVYTFVR